MVMTGAYWLIGAMTAILTAFAAVFALAFWVTGGSAWMPAFFPAFIAVPGWVGVKTLAPLFRSLDD